MKLTAEDIALILELIAEKYGRGYSVDARIGKLQAKLSMLGALETARPPQRRSDGVCV